MFGQNIVQGIYYLNTFLAKFENKLKKYLIYYRQKCVFTKGPFMEKISKPWPSIFGFSECSMKKEATLTISKVSYLLKHPKQIWLLNGEY